MTHVTGALPAAAGEALSSSQVGAALPPAGADVEPGGRRSFRVIARSLFLLTKPRIIELLLVTTLPSTTAGPIIAPRIIGRTEPNVVPQ